MSADWYVPKTQKCHDCGVQKPCDERGNPLSGHECRSDDIRVQQATLAAWEDGYGFALRNFDDELVQKDVAEFGSGWVGFVRNGGPVEVEVGEDDSDV